MADIVAKWTPGPNYGPVLTPNDVYLLQPELELHPILKGNSVPSFVFNLATGVSAMYNVNDRERDLPFTRKHEPATLPRVTELSIITRLSPWCTTIKSESGITLEHLCGQLWKESYGETYMTDAEFGSVPPRMQEQIKRNAAASQPNGWNFYQSPAASTMRYRCADLLRTQIYFDRLEKEDEYVKTRLGFTAPNIFVMHLIS